MDREHAYEVWRVAEHPAYGGEWTWYVLKKWQSPSNEATNPYARWYCNVVSPFTSARGETGDVYAAEIKAIAHQLDYNPFASTSTYKQTTGRETKVLLVQSVTDDVRHHFTVVDLTPKARKRKQYQIALPAQYVHIISPERSIIGPIEFYDCQDGRIIVTDHAWNQVNASMQKPEGS